jgi:hypothetical protein
MLLDWLKHLVGSPPEFRHLDDLLDEVARAGTLADRQQLWKEVSRRFVQDVERACRIAGVDRPREKAGDILAEALRDVIAEEPRYFSRLLVRIMKRHLGTAAVEKVWRSLYLRQFISELPDDLVPYVHGMLDQELRGDLLARQLHETEQTVRTQFKKAWELLVRRIEAEYDADEVADRTENVWTIERLKERDD